jgi:hypothetical protein
MKIYGNKSGSKDNLKVKKKETSKNLNNLRNKTHFTPDLEISKEVKEKKFIPDLNIEKNLKKSKFTPDLEIPKEDINKKFTPDREIPKEDINKKFTPDREIPKEIKSRNSTLDLKLNGNKNKSSISRISEITQNNKTKSNAYYNSEKSNNFKLNLNSQLAEFMGICLGDGCLYKKGNKSTITISLNRIDEERYVTYVKNVIFNLFHKNPSEAPFKGSKAINLNLYDREFFDELIKLGLKSGNKVDNQVRVPSIIKNNQNLKAPCLKGLIDTDGSVWVNFSHRSIYISFRNASLPLVKDFKELCENLNIKPQPKITENHEISEKTGKMLSGYQLFISSKVHVKRFLETINPEKWKDLNRRDYIGTFLILANSEISVQEKVFKRIEKAFPKKSDHRYSIKFANQFKEICIEYGLNINRKSIELAISNALEYKVPVYSKDDAERLKSLFEQLGSYKSIRKYELDHSNLPRKEEQISKHVKLLFLEPDYFLKYGQNGYKNWYKKNSKMIIDKKVSKFQEFQLENRKIISRNIFEILNKSKSLDNDQIIKEMKLNFRNLEFKRLLNLLNEPETEKLTTFYIEKHIEFVKYIMKHKIDIKYPTKIWRVIKLPGKQAYAKELIDNLVDNFTSYFSNQK